MLASFVRPAALRARVCAIRFIDALAVGLAGALLAACGGGGGGSSPPPDVTILTQPADVHAIDGDFTTMSVTARNAGSYEWQRLGPDGWADVPAATGSTLPLGSVHTTDSGAQFRVIVASTASSASRVTSSTATLTVDALVVAPSLQSGPQTSNVYDGQDVTLNVTALGTTLAYRWQRSDDLGQTWRDLAGATGAGYAFTATMADNGSEFRVVVGNGAGSLTTVPAFVTVNAAPAVPTITLDAQSATAAVGQPASFSVQGVATPAPTVQWQSSYGGNGSWTDIPGATSGSYVIASTTAADDGRLFRAVLTNANGIAMSNQVQLSVTTGPSAPGISEQPRGSTVAVGAWTTFEAFGYGSPGVGYQWQVSADGGASFTNVNGATSSTFTAGPVSLSDSGKRYRVVVANDLGSAASDAAQLTVMEVPTLLNWGTSVYWRPGVTDSAARIDAAGEQLSYRWQIGVSGGTMTDVPGATGTTLVIPASSPASTNVACATVSNPVGSETACTYLTALTWQIVSPRPTPNSIYSIARVDGQTAVAFDSSGTALRSTDAGTSWRTVSEGFAYSSGERSMAFSGQDGIAVGYLWDIRLSSDGGVHWTQGASDSLYAAAVAFTPTGLAVKVGQDGSIRLSSDKGLSWSSAVQDTNTNTLTDVAFNSTGVGIAVGAGGSIRRSADGGHTWTTVHIGGASMQTVAFASDAIVVAGDALGTFWRSVDGGLSFTSLGGGSIGNYIGRVRFSPDGIGFASAPATGAILHSADAGLTWTAVSMPMTGVEDFAFLDGGVVLAAGDGGMLLRSTDGGLNFTAAGVGPRTMLMGVAAADSQVAVAVGLSGMIRRTADAGATWTTIASHVSVELGAVAFDSATQGLAVGDNGLALRTADAGLTWSSVNTGAIGLLRSVAYASPSVVVASGYNGMVRSTDGGLSWSAVPGFGMWSSVDSVAFGDSQVGLAGVGGGQLWRTADAGQTWTQVAASGSPITGIAFASPSVAVAVTFQGGSLRSTDGGVTWQTVTMPYSQYLQAVTFRDANNGYAVGGAVVTTKDGGATWSADPGAKFEALDSVVAMGAHTVVGVGAAGMVYRSTAY